MKLMRNLVLTAAAVGLLAAAPAAFAKVEDAAGVFSPEAVEQANKVIAEVRDKYKLNLTVETFKEPPAEWADRIKAATDKTERNDLFRRWADEQAETERVKGVYVLINMKPGRVQTAADRETRNRGFADSRREKFAGHLTSAFGKAADKPEAEQRKLHDEGLLAAVKYLQEQAPEMKAVSSGKSGAPLAGGNFGGRGGHAAGNVGNSIGGWVCIALTGLLGVWLVIGLIRAFTGGGGAGGGMGGGGGGFMSGLMGGLFGAMAGAYLYDQFMGHGSSAFGGDNYGGDAGGDTGAGDFSGDSGAGGGDFGGGDYGGGDFGGGDFGGGGDF